MMREVIAGFRSYGHAWRLAWKGKLWPLLLVPGLIGLLYFPFVIVLTFSYGGSIADYIRDHWVPNLLNHDVLFFLVTVVLWLGSLYLGFLLFRNMVMILYSPVLALLSRKTEEKHLLTAGGELGSGIVRGAIRGIVMSLTSLGLAIVCFCVCVALLLVPIVGEIAMVVILPLSQMLLAGHGFIDPTLERRDYSIIGSFKFVWQHRYRALGCGAAFVLLSMIPVIGWFLAPTLGIVAGTLLALDKLALPATATKSANEEGRMKNEETAEGNRLR